MKKLKQVLIVWASIYPTITLILYFFGEPLWRIPLALRTLVLTAVLVPLMIFVLIPFWTKLLSSFSKKEEQE